MLLLNLCLDLVICRFAFRTRQIQFVHIDSDLDMMLRGGKFGQKCDRLDMPRNSRIRVQYAITVQGNKSDNRERSGKHIYG